MGEQFAVKEEAGVLSGGVRQPRNSAINAGAGSIHDNATAKNLGFRGGTVAGSLHMEQFPPLLVTAFGDEWYHNGGMSLYFKYATTDAEPVQAFADKPADGSRQTRIWMDDDAANRVCEGTASVGGPDPQSAVRQRIATVPEPQGLRILADVEVGMTGTPIPCRVTEDMLAARLAVITEHVPAYTDTSLFGGKIMTPALHVRTLSLGVETLLPRDRSFGVGLYGAIELQAINGPALVEKDYETWTRILAVGETPKTEYFFHEAVLADPATGDEVMRMLMMLRFMKASSPLYQD